MKTITARPLKHTLAAATVAACVLAGTPARAQDFGAMIQQQMAAMNANIARGQQQVNGIVQQRMNDPQVRAAYGQYLNQMAARGQRPMDFQTYTYNYIYTNGYSSAGMAHARNTEAGIQAQTMASVAGLRAAEANRGAAMQQQQQSFFNNQQEAGRQLMGNSTFYGANGTSSVLPHTWQANTTHSYQGNTYHVNASGQYYVLASNGWWYPVNR